MTAQNLMNLFVRFLQQGAPGKLTTTVKFKNPTDRINLPIYPSEKNGRDFVRFKKDNFWQFVVMSHPQTINQFEEALLRSCQDAETNYPQVTINYRKAERVVNLIEEPHRIYSSFLLEEHDKLFFVSTGNKKWTDTEEFKKIYDNDPITRIHAVIKYSPLTILFGGWGNHYRLAKPPRYTSLVETEITGTSTDQEVFTRRGQGGFFPPAHIAVSVPTAKVTTTTGKKVIKYSEIGRGIVPMTLHATDPKRHSHGAIFLTDISLEANLIFDRLCALRLRSPEETVAFKTYLISLWLHMFWLGYKRGFSHYQGRELIAEKYTFEMLCPKPYEFPGLIKPLAELDPTLCAEFHKLALARVVELGLVDLKPLNLVASEALDKAIAESKASSKSKE